MEGGSPTPADDAPAAPDANTPPDAPTIEGEATSFSTISFVK
jgi:hypothetical protein